MMEIWITEISQASEEEQEKAKQLIKAAVVDENQVMIIWYGYDLWLATFENSHFFQPNKVFQQKPFNKNMSHECYRMQVAKYRLH